MVSKPTLQPNYALLTPAVLFSMIPKRESKVMATFNSDQKMSRCAKISLHISQEVKRLWYMHESNQWGILFNLLCSQDCRHPCTLLTFLDTCCRLLFNFGEVASVRSETWGIYSQVWPKSESWTKMFSSDLLSDCRLVFLVLAALWLYAFRHVTGAKGLSALLSGCLYLEAVQPSVHNLRAQVYFNLSVLFFFSRNKESGKGHSGAFFIHSSVNSYILIHKVCHTLFCFLV